jgi:hypothetical protein
LDAIHRAGFRTKHASGASNIAIGTVSEHVPPPVFYVFGFRSDTFNFPLGYLLRKGIGETNQMLVNVSSDAQRSPGKDVRKKTIGHEGFCTQNNLLNTANAK